MPLNCPADSICPIQQYIDVDAGPGAQDPWCGTQTYDGHKGTDFRVLSMQQGDAVSKSSPWPKAWSKPPATGWPTGSCRADEDRQAVSSRECGNGLILDHGNGS
jgi:hypothetical protein